MAVRILSMPWSHGLAQGVTAPPPPPPGGTPDPMLLPAAADQPLDVIAYTALGVPAMTPGQSYTDPVTGVTIVKLTTDSSPVASAGTYASGVDYSAGGCRIGRPTGGVYPIAIQAKVETSVEYHIMTFNPTTHTVGYRSASPGAGSTEIAKAMSLVTPDLMYAFAGAILRKYDISGSSPSEITGGLWPKDFTAYAHSQPHFTWLQCTLDDRYFAMQAGDAGPWVVLWDSQTDTIKDHQFTFFNEFKLMKDGPFVHATGFSAIWDWAADVERAATNTSGTYLSHNDTLRGYLFGFDGDDSKGMYRIPLSDTSPALVAVDTSYYVGNLYSSGAWVDQASDTTQWATMAYQNFVGSEPPFANQKVRRSGIWLERLDGTGGPRLLCHTYGLGNVNGTPQYYHNSTWPNMSPDGKFCLFKSNMNVIDTFASLFAAILPTS